MKTATVDFSKPLGLMKPVHGVNNGPVTRMFSLNMSEYFREAGIPYSRLHDTEYPYGSGHFVDIPCIFPDFDADPMNPQSYDFTLTDEYIKAIIDSGTKVFYRLGVSIEHASKKYNIFPPKDYDQWAKICAGIVRHYNQGWADGFHYQIEYWEIWNEPENPPMWQGTKEEYFRLYVKTANTLKTLFPDIKIGGYAGCGFYSLTRKNTSAFYQGFISYFTDFLEYISSAENRAPLDFFSWHLYTTSISEMAAHARYVKKTLLSYGFDKTESILNEWNYVTGKPGMFEQMKQMSAASFVAGSLCTMQKAAVDLGAYYDAQPSMQYCGLFDYTGPQKPFYSFKAFNELYKLKHEVFSACEKQHVMICAAGTNQEGAILLAACNSKPERLLVEITGFDNHGVETEYYLLDEVNNLELKRSELYYSGTLREVVELGKDTVVLIKLKMRLEE
ncbi:MAG: glycoside hydrolase family 44 protein [Clostridiaceae bacterium]|nr:glycoside hydrolase family 44 protein [Clostridiaceae bacterium]